MQWDGGMMLLLSTALALQLGKKYKCKSINAQE